MSEWVCRLCDELVGGAVPDHFRVLHPADYETWTAEPAFEVVHYERGDTDWLVCWSHDEGAPGEMFVEGDVAVLIDPDDCGINIQLCTDCFAAGAYTPDRKDAK